LTENEADARRKLGLTRELQQPQTAVKNHLLIRLILFGALVLATKNSATILISGVNNQTQHGAAPDNTTEPTAAPKQVETKQNMPPQVQVNTPITHPLVNGEVIIDPSYPRVIVVGIWFRYPSLMRLQVASIQTYLKRSSMEYVAVLNGRTKRENTVFGMVAKQLGVHSFPVRNKRARPSYNHAFALNAIYHHLLHGNGTVQLRPGIDTLFIIDTDMFLMAPFDVSKFQVWSRIQTQDGTGGVVRYLWPNLVVLRLGSNITVYDEISFAHCPYRNANMDSGGCTARFVDDHPEFPLTGVTNQSCNATETPTPACQYHAQQVYNASTTPDHCTPAALFDNTIFHLGAAGSNYNGCPEEYLKNRRQDIHHFFQRTLSNETVKKNFLNLEVE
jgi:hypothetical protein